MYIATNEKMTCVRGPYSVDERGAEETLTWPCSIRSSSSLLRRGAMLQGTKACCPCTSPPWLTTTLWPLHFWLPPLLERRLVVASSGWTSTTGRPRPSGGGPRRGGTRSCQPTARRSTTRSSLATTARSWPDAASPAPMASSPSRPATIPTNSWASDCERPELGFFQEINMIGGVLYSRNRWI
jgi:hypothetical protein